MNLARVEAVVRRRIGLDPGSLGGAFPRAVAGRMRAAGLASADAYAGLIAADPASWAALVAELVVPETWFFRGGREYFAHLAAWVAGRPAGRAVRVLCVPCSTGEEPYSLAVALTEAGVPPARVTIDAVDLSDDHLRRAAAGRYAAYSFREPGPDPRPAFFAAVGGQWELSPAVRARVRFRAANVADADFLAGEPPYDLILCRNLLIYLTAEVRERVMGRLDSALAPGGLLGLTAPEADDLPAGRFVADGPPAFCLYRPADPTPARAARAAPPPTLASGGRVPPVASSRTEGARPPLATRPPEPTPPPVAVLAPPDPEAAARVLADAGRLDEARAACEQALASTPTAGLHCLRGVIHLAAGERDAAAESFRKALYLDPDHAESLDHLAALADRRGDRPAAAAFRRRLARLTPEARA